MGISCLEQALEVAKTAASAAGEKIMQVYHSNDFQIAEKADGEPVGIADKLSNEAIIRIIHNRDADYGILAEESIGPEALPGFPDTVFSAIENWREREYCWLIDSLDGTVDFINKTGEFGIHIALTHNGKPVLGVNYYPATKMFYYAITGKGAYISTADETSLIQVSDADDISKIRVLTSAAFPDQKVDAMISALGMKSSVRVGSMGLKICRVADGSAELYLNANKTFGLWDSCSSQLIILEAGGIITDLNGNSFDYRLRSSTKFKDGIVVTNGKMHEALLKCIREFYFSA